MPDIFAFQTDLNFTLLAFEIIPIEFRPIADIAAKWIWAVQIFIFVLLDK
jgi:hypothetical protein